MGSPVNLASNMEKAEREGKLSTGSTFKLKEGPNRMRIVQGFLAHNSSFNGKPTFKWLTRVIDRRDGKVKAFFMGHTIYKQLVAFQQDSESGTDFDELPMPYDINVNAVGAGTMEAKYTVVASRQSVPLTLAEEAAVGSEDSLEDLQEALLKKSPTVPTTPVMHDDDSEVPF